MCISILSERYITFELLAEHIFLEIKKGKLHAREVYDCIFSLSNDWGEPQFTCISPHMLLKDGELNVKAVIAPGAGSADDVVYNTPIGFGSNFNVDTRTLSIKISDLRKPESPQTIDLSGEVISPLRIIVPHDIVADELAVQVISVCGTLFELHLPPLKANTNYAMRLVVEPVELVGLSPPRCLDRFGLLPIKASWTQDASITCPKHCWFDCKKLLVKTQRQNPELVAPAAAIEAIISNDKLKIVRVKQNRITLILPAGYNLLRETTIGCISSMGSVSTNDYREFFQYAGGIEQHWVDDVEFLGFHIWKYMSQWAKTDPKSKEYITTALGIQHNNSSLIVDSLAKHNLIEIVDLDRGLYKPKNVTEDIVQKVLREIASDPEISKSFDFAGYRIQFTIQYRYLSAWNQVRFVWEKTKLIMAFWLAVAAIILGLAALSGQFRTACLEVIRFVQKIFGS